MRVFYKDLCFKCKKITLHFLERNKYFCVRCGKYQEGGKKDE